MRNKSSPQVTVLMPVYNGARFLREAIDSILSQTYTNFIFLIIDDGSTDNTLQIIKSYQDPRIKLIQNDKNRGVIYSLNKGLKLIKSQYIARMDSDDISVPTRFEKQISYLESHPNVGLCGTWTLLFSTINKWQKLILKFPTQSAEIKCALLFENVIQHPSIMMRSNILGKNKFIYPVDFPHVEDYGLWINLSKYTDFAIIAEVLLKYRLHSERVGVKHGETQINTVAKLHLIQLKRLGLKPSTEELEIHENLSFGQYNISREFVIAVDSWLTRLITANNHVKQYDPRAFNKDLGKRWLSVCLSCVGLGPWVWYRFWLSPLGKAADTSTQLKMFFWGASRLPFFFGPLIKWTRDTKLGKIFHRLLLNRQ